ncbi:hypothetical protein [Sorangium sp. So ce1000]|uniref:hypothetical protein n=1 Tax=Sorangium sp. So ce1000 TaxID=3133325 RepID=UPI003F6296DC
MGGHVQRPAQDGGAADVEGVVGTAGEQPSTLSRRAASVAVGSSAAVSAGASTGARLIGLIGATSERG